MPKISLTETNGTFITLVKQAIERYIEDEVRKQVEIAKVQLEHKIPQIVAGVAIEIFDRIPLERSGRDLIIHGVWETEGK